MKCGSGSHLLMVVRHMSLNAGMAHSCKSFHFMVFLLPGCVYCGERDLRSVYFGISEPGISARQDVAGTAVARGARLLHCRLPACMVRDMATKKIEYQE